MFGIYELGSKYLIFTNIKANKNPKNKPSSLIIKNIKKGLP
ncbi:hypothetical protein PSOL_06030 [Candidatus Phytoplasma solani]